MRTPALVTFLAVVLSTPSSAQVTGRWRLTLEGGPRSPIMGELTLSEKDGRLEGALLLATRDSAWITLTEERAEPAGGVRFVADFEEQLRFEGRELGGELTGTASDRVERRYHWRGVRLDQNAEFYAAPPRFLQRQLIVGSRETHFQIPGRWLAAAAAAGETPAAGRARYRDIATNAGVAPLPPESLATAAIYRAMGLLNRKETVATAIRTLERIRQNIRPESTAARFDYLFRPAGRWLVDIHDVALARTQRPFPTLTWESARPALRGAGLLPSEPAGVESIPLAMYRLFALSHRDTAAFNLTQEQLRRADAPGAAAAMNLIGGYEEAAEWYVAVMRFLLEHRWYSGPSGPQSPVDLVRSAWGGNAVVPAVEIRIFGYPEGAVRVGIDPDLVGTIVSPMNAPAQDWLARHGPAELVAALHQVEPFRETTTLELGNTQFRLSSVGQYAAESFNGFLEPRDLILLDPSYQPILALGTLVHEWQHILHERRRQSDPGTPTFQSDGRQVVVHQLDPYLAEGLAEWLTEEILSPIFVDYPLFAIGEAEKRASLPDNNPHQLGYVMVRSLAAMLGDRGETLTLLIRRGSDPAAVLADRRVRAGWARYDGPDRMFSRRGGLSLLPQVLFIIDDAPPEILEFRILGTP